MRLRLFLSVGIVYLFVGCGSIETKDASKVNIPNSIMDNIDTFDSNSTNTTLEEVNFPEVINNQDTAQQEQEGNNTTQEDIFQPQITTQTTSDREEETPENNLTQIAQGLEEDEKSLKERYINKDKCNQIVDKEFFEVCYDYSLKVATSVAYTLEGDLVNELNIQQRPQFYEELTIDEPYRAKNSDYKGSGYDRGHLAPDASFDWSEESLEATYSLANVIPQVPEINRYTWSKVEKYARDKAVDLGKIDVINIIEYDKNQTKYIGEDNIAVSVGFYKILINEYESYEECFYYKNDMNISIDNDNILKHKVDCDTI